MNNVFNQPSYKKIQEMMMKKLNELKKQYKDPDPLIDPAKTNQTVKSF